MLTIEQKKQFNEILEELGLTLDISETQYKAAIQSYQAIGEWLSKEDSILASYNPEILPQGSFMLGTMIKPVNEEDDLDIDLVCQLEGKEPSWSQSDLKRSVGDQLKSHDTYKKMLDEEGRRCWTLLYRQESTNDTEKYHMDILPSVVDSEYRIILEKAFQETEIDGIDKLAIRITDNKEKNYFTEADHFEWMKSNPFGFGRWFYQQATIDFSKDFSINESIKPVPLYRKEKLPLQRVVQILKRHRDMMFEGDKNKPISVIITTLSAKAYTKEDNILEALQGVVSRIPEYIEKRYSPEKERMIFWVPNPVNEEENFADKWLEEPIKQNNFFKWLDQVKQDVEKVISQRGIPLIQESLENPFGKGVVTKAFSNYGNILLNQRQKGTMKMAAGTGMLGTAGRANVPQHNPFGKNE